MWQQTNFFFGKLPAWAANLIVAGSAILCGILLKWLISFLMARYARKEKAGFSFFRSSLFRLGKWVALFLPLLLLDLSLPLMQLSVNTEKVLEKTMTILLIISFSSILIGMIRVAEDYVHHSYNLKKSHNIRERKIRTQLQFIRKLLIAVIIVLAICAILLSFDSLRRIGAGLLTGVGVGGIIIGFAAQKSLGNLLAGLQIAFTQPIRIDDVLVVEGEWGRVEEITLTYVVVNIWDQRRLILPINYFIEKPFQNWTRNSSEILGTSFLYLDYTAPLDEIRKEFERIIHASPLWDKRVGIMQVTNLTADTLELRALISSGNSGDAFDLRCIIREELISFIQKNHPDCLPRTRAEFRRETR